MNKLRYWAYILYLLITIISTFVLAWDSDHFGQKVIPLWVIYICGAFYFSFWIKMMVEVLIPEMAFWNKGAKS